MKKSVTATLTSAFALLMLFSAVGCGGSSHDYTVGDDNMAQLTYPDFEETPDEKNSWEYISNEDVTIDWYVDVSSWAIPAQNNVIKKIKEKTGITVKFSTPVSDDGQKLATLIAGGLPDVVSVPTSNSKMLASLAQQGYVYDINTLADKWAPSLYDHLPKDVIDWWSYDNGKTYGIPNHYYSYEDIPEGEQLQPNGGLMVRKDLFDAWQKLVETTMADSNGMVTYTSGSGVEKQVEWQGYITTPEGFKAACLWALENNYGTGNGDITTALQLGQFTTSGNTSIEWLAQYFAVPFEDEEGNYLYRFTQESYADALYYLNDLYTTKTKSGNTLISNANFSQTYDGVGSVIAGGKAFATLATPQDYQMHFVTAQDSGYEYVSLYITNEDGDAPVLADIRGYGYLFNMISTNCERPDLVIKLFDYLSSDEGQRLISLGVEGEAWNWKDDTQTEIVFTEEYLADKAKLETAKYGQLSFDLLINYQYYDNVQPKTNNGKTKSELYRTNLKRPLSIYAYDYNATHFVVDATDERFQNYNSYLTRIDSRIVAQSVKIIQASTHENAEKIYNDTVTLLNSSSYNLDLIITMQKEAYLKAKEKLGITVAWPAYQEGYVSPLDRKNPNGDLSLYRTY